MTTSAEEQWFRKGGKRPEGPLPSETEECPYCSESVPGGIETCPRCGQPVNPDIDADGRPFGGDQCPKCGAKVEPDDVWCPVCGATVDGEGEDEDGDGWGAPARTCQGCGNPVPAGTDICPECQQIRMSACQGCGFADSGGAKPGEDGRRWYKVSVNATLFIKASSPEEAKQIAETDTGDSLDHPDHVKALDAEETAEKAVDEALDEWAEKQWFNAG